MSFFKNDKGNSTTRIIIIVNYLTFIISTMKCYIFPSGGKVGFERGEKWFANIK